MKSRMLLLVLLVTSVPAVCGQVYSWTDANGVKHFSDSPPPPNVTNAQKIKVHGGVTSGEAPAAPAPAATPADTTPAATPTQASNKPMVDSPENRAKQCQMAKQNLALLQSNYQVSAPVGADGKTQVLDDAGRKAAVARATDQVTFYCR